MHGVCHEVVTWRGRAVPKNGRVAPKGDVCQLHHSGHRYYQEHWLSAFWTPTLQSGSCQHSSTPSLPMCPRKSQWSSNLSDTCRDFDEHPTTHTLRPNFPRFSESHDRLNRLAPRSPESGSVRDHLPLNIAFGAVVSPPSCTFVTGIRGNRGVLIHPLRRRPLDSRRSPSTRWAPLAR